MARGCTVERDLEDEASLPRVLRLRDRAEDAGNARRVRGETLFRRAASLRIAARARPSLRARSSCAALSATTVCELCAMRTASSSVSTFGIVCAPAAVVMASALVKRKRRKRKVHSCR